ncbi:MAG: hypothetical protein H5T64_06270 [Chloroflexi bacterium]|nr:hypothetical protein [Chloroflexota bacterium]
MPAYIENTDSSAIAMRSVAAALRGEFFASQDRGPLAELAARFISLLGPRAITWAVERVVATSGINPRFAHAVRTENLAQYAVSLYHDCKGPYSAVILGAPNGGVAHLATALGVPFLSEHFLTSYRDPAHPDDIATYKAHGDALAQPILANNPDLAVVNHYDPLHDRFLVKYVNHIRMKLLALPQAYRDFIRIRLQPGGTIIFIDCRYLWRQYRVAERHTFQVGGLGGVSDEQFMTGTPEIEAMQRAEGSPFVGGWRLDLPLSVEPESEWGTLPEFRAACEAFARQNGYQFLALEGNTPEAFSVLAYRAHRKLSEKEGRQPRGVFFDCFTLVNPVASRISRLLPLWLPFNCRDSLDFLRRMLPEIPTEMPVLFAPLPNFAPAFDTVPMAEWQTTLSNHKVNWLGINPRLYPTDILGLLRFRREIESWCQAHPDPVRAHLTVEELTQLIQRGTHD